MAEITEELRMLITADTEAAKKALADLEARIKGIAETSEEASQETRDLASAHDNAAASARRQGISIAELAAGYAAAALSIGSIYSALREAYLAAEEENRSLERLQATLEATGRNGEISVRRIDAAASVLEDTLFADKQAIIDASAELAIMENVSSSLFERIFTTAADLSAVLGTDIRNAITDLGRALEDPEEGMTRLRRQGIFISDGLTGQIIQLQNQNRLYEAQSLLLDEIDSKVGGTAEQMADVSAALSFSTAVGKFQGAFGQYLTDVFGPAIQAAASGISFLADRLDDIHAYISSFTIPAELRDFSIAGIGTIDTAKLSELKETAEAFIAGPSPAYWIMAAQDEWEGLLPLIEDELAMRKEAAAEAEKAAKAERERKQLLADEQRITADLKTIYETTDTGHIAALREEISALSGQAAADRSRLDNLLADPAADQGHVATLSSRITYYEAIIQAKQEELKGLTEIAHEASLTERILGTSAEDYAMNIPISFDFGRTEEEELEEQLAMLRNAINSLWRSHPLEEELGEWEDSLRILSGRYDGIAERLEEINAEKREAEIYSELQARAEAELDKLLSDEERRKKQIAEYTELLSSLLDESLITEEEYNALLGKAERDTRRTGENIEGWQEWTGVAADSFSEFYDRLLSAENLSGIIGDIFYSWGEAIASGNSSGEALMSSLGDWVQQITREMSSMFITAGLRCIIEGGWAGLGIGLALIAAGGMSSFASGIFGGGGPALSDEIMESMEDEMEARQKLADSINASIDTEYELLKRQLERNLISEEQFAAEAGDLQHQRDIAEARVQLTSSVFDRITALNNEYAGMSGWDKFWSGRDEDISREIAILREYYDLIDNATVDELRNLVKLLRNMGVSVGNVPAFANGGEFITSGPQLILVGDNQSGHEHVRITPLDSPNDTSGNTTVIQIIGDVYGWEDLYRKLHETGAKIERRKRA